MRKTIRVLAVNALLLALGSTTAHAQQSEFELPDFSKLHADAGVAAPPPMPPIDPGPSAPPPPPTVGVIGIPVVPAPVAPQPVKYETPYWQPLTATAGGVLVGLAGVFVGGEVMAGVQLGKPTLLEKVHTIGGWLFVPGLLANYGQMGGAFCGNTQGLCASRFQGGPTIKIGHASGTAPPSGSTRPSEFFFGQLDVLPGVADVPSAPLAGGARWFELAFRARVGLQWAKWGGSSTNGLAVTASVVTEVVAIGKYTQGVMLGLSAGLAL